MGLDFQYTYIDLLFKTEVIVRDGFSETYAAAVSGFEYTFYQMFDSDSDFSILFEYIYSINFLDMNSILEVISSFPWWLWIIIYGVLGSLFYATYQSYEASGSLFQTDTLTLLLMSILLPALFYTLKLKTRITAEGIYVRFVPFHWKEKFIS